MHDIKITNDIAKMIMMKKVLVKKIVNFIYNRWKTPNVFWD